MWETLSHEKVVNFVNIQFSSSECIVWSKHFILCKLSLHCKELLIWKPGGGDFGLTVVVYGYKPNTVVIVLKFASLQSVLNVFFIGEE